MDSPTDTDRPQGRRAVSLALLAALGVYAALVAILAIWMRFGLWEQSGLMYALLLAAPFVPLIDRLWPGRRYRWPGRVGPVQGSHDAATILTPALPARRSHALG